MPASDAANGCLTETDKHDSPIEKNLASVNIDDLRAFSDGTHIANNVVAIPAFCTLHSLGFHPAGFMAFTESAMQMVEFETVINPITAAAIQLATANVLIILHHAKSPTHRLEWAFISHR